MNAFQKLLCLMKIQHNNLTTLHRNLVKDAGWFGNHSQLGDWYDALFDQLDDLCEIGLSLGFKDSRYRPARVERILSACHDDH